MSAEAPGSIRPDRLDEFRQGRLLLLLNVLSLTSKPQHAPDLERLSFYDFFAANPFLVPIDDRTGSSMSIAGFDRSNLSYQSSGQRFANGRARLQFDLAVLAARGLISASVHNRRVTYAASNQGLEVAKLMRSLYAQAYEQSARVILDRLRRLSDKGLRESAREWLRAEALLVDIYDLEPASVQ